MIDSEHIIETLDAQNGSYVLLPDFDDALIGVCYEFGKATSAAYDYNKIIDILIEDSDMDREAAEEYFEFNILGAHISDESNPVFIDFLDIERDYI